MTAKEYVDIDYNNIQLCENPTDETIIQMVLIEEGIKDEIVPSSDDDDEEEEEEEEEEDISIITVRYITKFGLSKYSV
jgi:hypothetical protein